jgi:hypothetical protein
VASGGQEGLDVQPRALRGLPRLPATKAARARQHLPRRDSQQLHKRRCDLLDTNLDLLEDIGTDAEALDIIMADIHANRRAVEALNRILDNYSDTITN